MTPAELTKQFNHFFDAAPVFMVKAPGRINIIGEHTDYNNGFVMPGAIDRHLLFAVAPNDSSVLNIRALDIKKETQIDLNKLVPSGELWIDYIAGIVQEFQKLGFSTPGLNIVFGGNLPIGAGVSSSAALETGMAAIWNKIVDAKLNGPALAALCQRSSHQFVGIPCGIMDQFAVLMGEHEKVILLDCQSLVYETIPAAIKDYEWVLLNSKVSHELANSEYPVRVRECQEGVAILKQSFPTIQSLREVNPAQIKAHQNRMSAKVFNRCLFVTSENERVQQMKKALATGDAVEAGKLLHETHLGLSELYEVSCPEIEVLIDFTKKHEAVAGARIMGGGFGGCTLNLVKKEGKENFIKAALANYKKATQIEGEYLEVKLSRGLEIIPL